MISKETLGRRVRDVRQRQKMTLKDVEGVSGLSSTHISEIERGMTSPTIGALIRIAHALGKDPSFFIEERELEEISVTSDGERPAECYSNGAHGTEVERGSLEALTRGILGGRICAHELNLDPGGSADLTWLRVGEDVCFYCVEGKAGLSVGKQQMMLTPGDSVHGALPHAPRVDAGADVGCRLLIIEDPREELQ